MVWLMDLTCSIDLEAPLRMIPNATTSNSTIETSDLYIKLRRRSVVHVIKELTSVPSSTFKCS